MDELLEKVVNNLNISDSSKNKTIQGYIDTITSKIKSICNRKDFPKELNYLAIKYAMDCYIYYKNKNNDNNECLQVTSATDNNQSVSFKTTEIVTKDDVDVNKVIEKNADEISMYAYMRW